MPQTQRPSATGVEETDSARATDAAAAAAIDSSFSATQTVAKLRRLQLAAPAADTPRALRREPITLLIPAHNEEDGLGGAIEEARAAMAGQDIPCEIIVIDDGSTDGTAEVARARGVRLLRHLYGRGYGYALRSGILAASHETIVICDADGTYPLSQLPGLLAKFAEGYDLVIGARQGKHYRSSPAKSLARWVFHRMCESASGTRIADANSGLRVFRKSAIAPHLSMMCTGFSFTTSQTLCFLLLGHPVAFVPIKYRRRIGTTKIRHLPDSLRTAQYIFQIYAMFNPVKLFTMLAQIPLLVGVGVLMATGIMALAGWSAPWAPLILLSGLAFHLAAMLFGAGFVIFGVSRQKWPAANSGHESPEVSPSPQ